MKQRETTFSDRVLDFYRHLHLDSPLPGGVEVMNPYRDKACMDVCSRFYEKFYGDYSSRHLIVGINPGRYGAGITGIPFTDPIKLETLFGIGNTLPKKPELSAGFIHMMIDAYGGAEKFFRSFFINSVSPLGFVQAGKNINYYDTPQLRENLKPFITQNMRALMGLGVHRHVVFCLGEGENYRYLSALNDRENLFERVVALAHPRFIMQYKRKKIADYISAYLEKFNEHIR